MFLVLCLDFIHCEEYGLKALIGRERGEVFQVSGLVGLYIGFLCVHGGVLGGV